MNTYTANHSDTTTTTKDELEGRPQRSCDLSLIPPCRPLFRLPSSDFSMVGRSSRPIYQGMSGTCYGDDWGKRKGHARERL